MREQISWHVGEDQIFATLDIPADIASQSALIIVSGGNEIRSGSHNSQSQLAQYLCAKGHYVLRYDRRGIGDSKGENLGFEGSKDDIIAAVTYLRSRMEPKAQISAFGNCDAASALLLNHSELNLFSLILTNPWTYDPVQNDVEKNSTDENESSTPDAAAIRARYWARIKNPRSIIDLFSGKIDLRKLIKGLMNASKKVDTSALAQALNIQLSDINIPAYILIADKDNTAMAFMSAYNSADFAQVRTNPNVNISKLDSASHSFADQESKTWLHDRLATILDR